MDGTNSSSLQQSVEGSPVDKQPKLSNPCEITNSSNQIRRRRRQSNSDDSLINEKGNYSKV